MLNVLAKVKAHPRGSTVILITIVILLLGITGLKFFDNHLASPNGNILKIGEEKDSQEIISEVIDGHPQECAKRLGFDNYRTFHSFAIDPQDSKTLYVAVEFKGVFKSQDGGTTWRAITKGLRGYPKRQDPGQPCHDQHPNLIVDPSNPKRLLLTSSTSPGFLTDPSSENGGVYESTDGGDSWHQLFDQDMNAWTYEALVIDPTDNKTVYVGTNALPASHREADPNKIYVKKGIIYKTTNGGDSWQELPTGLVPYLRSGRLFINPENTKELLFTTMALPANQGGGQVQSDQLGIVHSADGGESWQSLKSLPKNHGAIREADVSPQNFKNIFIYASPSNQQEFKYYSQDGGQTFSRADTQANLFRYDPNDKTGLRLLGLSVYAQPRTIFESLDGGKSWHPYSSLPKEVTNDIRVSNIVWDPQVKNTVYLNGDEGKIWKSVDGGQTWELILSLEKLG